MSAPSLHAALALLVRQPEAIATLRKIISKIIDCPDDPKYRKLRAANSKLQTSLLSLEGGGDALLALGFALVDESEGTFYVRPLNSPVALLAAVEAIEAAVHAPVEAATNSTAGAIIPVAAPSAGTAATEVAVAEVDDTDPMTAAQLLLRWQSKAVAHKKVVSFYSDKPSAGPLRVFSNFSEHAVWEYTIPLCCGRTELAKAGRPTTVPLTFAEKGIMLCKASSMGCYEMYDEILKSSSPASAKKLGRGVYPWDQELWDRVVCTVAKTVVLSKFASDKELCRVLLSTGDQLIAEAARNDRNWGIGLDAQQPDVALPAKWRGANILGWALMEARAALRAAAAPAATPTQT